MSLSLLFWCLISGALSLESTLLYDRLTSSVTSNNNEELTAKGPLDVQDLQQVERRTSDDDPMRISIELPSEEPLLDNFNGNLELGVSRSIDSFIARADSKEEAPTELDHENPSISDSVSGRIVQDFLKKENEIVEDLKNRISDALTDKKERIADKKESILKSIDKFNELNGKLAQNFVEKKQLVWDTILKKKNLTAEAVSIVAAYKNEIAQSIMEKKKSVLQQIVDKTMNIIQGFIDKKMSVLQALKDKKQNIVEIIQTKKQNIVNKTKEIIQELIDKKLDLEADLAEKKQDLIEAISNKKQNIIEGLAEKKQNFIQYYTDKKTNAIQQFSEKAQEFVGTASLIKPYLITQIQNVFSSNKEEQDNVDDDIVLTDVEESITTTESSDSVELSASAESSATAESSSARAAGFTSNDDLEAILNDFGMERSAGSNETAQIETLMVFKDILALEKLKLNKTMEFLQNSFLTLNKLKNLFASVFNKGSNTTTVTTTTTSEPVLTEVLETVSVDPVDSNVEETVSASSPTPLTVEEEQSPQPFSTENSLQEIDDTADTTEEPIDLVFD